MTVEEIERRRYAESDGLFEVISFIINTDDEKSYSTCQVYIKNNKITECQLYKYENNECMDESKNLPQIIRDMVENDPVRGFMNWLEEEL